MSRFSNNPKARAQSVPVATTVNNAGGAAYSKTAELELVNLLYSSFLSKTAYETEDEIVKRITTLCAQIEDKSFVAKAALYARNELGMRSVSHLVAGEIASKGYASGTSWGRTFFDAIVHRVDDMAEIMGYFLANDHKALPNSLKAGFASAFDRFDAYQLAKYRGESQAVKLIDVVRLVRPKATAKNAEALTALVKGELRATKTWETKLSAAGQATASEKVQAKADVWKDLLAANQLGYIALMRNITNIAVGADDNTFALALTKLLDKAAMSKALVMPFQLYLAAKEVESNSSIPAGRRAKVVDTLSAAVDLSLVNVPSLPGRTLVCVDNSGSMSSGVSTFGRTCAIDIATLFGVVLAKASANADLVIFNDTAAFVPVMKSRSVLDTTRVLAQTTGGTAFESIFRLLNAKEVPEAYDRILVLSDMQSWVGSTGGPFASMVKAYRAKTQKPNMSFVSWDLTGTTSMQVPQDDARTIVLGGWSDKIFDILTQTEQDRNALVNAVKAYAIKVPSKTRE